MKSVKKTDAVERDCIFAFDIGGTYLKSGLIHGDGTVTDREVRKMSDFEDFRSLVETMSGMIPDNVEKVAVSCPGFFTDTGLCMGGIENIPYMTGENISEELMRRNGRIQVRTVNDGLAAAAGEYVYGAGAGCRDLVVITLGTGIGCGVILGGRIHRGAHGMSGEIGYSGYRTPEDCVECHWSASAVMKKAGELKGREISGEEFFRLVRLKDAEICHLFDEWTDRIGFLAAGAVLFADPERVLIGGGVSAAGDIFIDKIREKTEMRLPEHFRRNLCIEACANRNDAGLLGAAALFAEEELL